MAPWGMRASRNSTDAQKQESETGAETGSHLPHLGRAYSLSLFQCSFSLRDREREHEQGEGRERGGGKTESQAGSTLAAQSLSLNSRAVRS